MTKHTIPQLLFNDENLRKVSLRREINSALLINLIILVTSILSVHLYSEYSIFITYEFLFILLGLIVNFTLLVRLWLGSNYETYPEVKKLDKYKKELSEYHTYQLNEKGESLDNLEKILSGELDTYLEDLYICATETNTKTNRKIGKMLNVIKIITSVFIFDLLLVYSAIIISVILKS